MIEILIEQKSNGLLRVSASGHAIDKNGNVDRIVCAAASALAFTLGQCVLIASAEAQLKNKPQVLLKDGTAMIQAYPTEEDYNEVLHTFWVYMVGVCTLERSYPQYVKVKTNIKPIVA